uniref:lysophospholipid acyltransferase family protein n=1 Tax=Agathobacter sp. TaxID=2021311 RepID=UPI0040571167
MKTIIIILFILCFFIVGYPLLGFFWIYGKNNPHKADTCQLRIVQFALRVMQFFSGCKLTVIGEENVPKDEAVLYVANHRSMFDIVYTYSRVPRLTGYIAKSGVLKVPALRAWMKRLHCLFLDRDDIKQGLKTILTAIDLVKSGVSICIFPEGTRNRDSADSASLLEFKDGSFKIAQKTNCKIVPIAITGTNKIFEDQFPWVKKADIIIEYGQPIPYNELSPEAKKHIGAHFRNVIQGMLEAHKTRI